MSNQSVFGKKFFRYSFGYIDCILLVTLFSFYSAYFALLKIDSTCYIGLAGLFISLLCALLVRLNMALLGGVLSAVTVIVIACAFTYTLGWESGFQYYLFCLCPFVFLSGTVKLRLKIFTAGLCTGAYILLRQANLEITGAISAGALRFLSEINLILIFAAVTVIIVHYTRKSATHGTKLRVDNIRLSKLAQTDPLTGLFNRRYIIKVIEQEIAMYEIKRKPFALAIADIDNFKRINDIYGHEEGDNAIKIIAECLKGVLRKEDVVARWGGEEFLLLLPHTSLEQSLVAAEKARNAVAQLNMINQKQSYRLTVTIGVSAYTGSQKIQDLFNDADANLYSGKRSGKNKVIA